jgi:hypothetical protein
VRGIEVDNMPVPMPSQEQIKKASFFKNNISREDLSALWVAVKA